MNAVGMERKISEEFELACMDDNVEDLKRLPLGLIDDTSMGWR